MLTQLALNAADITIIVKTATCTVGFDNIHLVDLFYGVLRDQVPASEFLRALVALLPKADVSGVMNMIAACAGQPA